jgi:hypothetical protein
LKEAIATVLKEYVDRIDDDVSVDGKEGTVGLKFSLAQSVSIRGIRGLSCKTRRNKTLNFFAIFYTGN